MIHKSSQILHTEPLLSLCPHWLEEGPTSIPPPHPLSSFSSLPGLNLVEEVVPALVELLQGAADLSLLGLVAGQQQLLAQLLQVALVLAEQVDFLHAVLRERKQKRSNKPYRTLLILTGRQKIVHSFM